MKRPHDPILDLIEESFSAVGDRAGVGLLGQRLKDWAEEASQSDDYGKPVIDPETDAKIQFLKDCESKGDLAWMKYTSWNVFERNFGDQFVRLLDPLFWRAVYFSYSEFDSVYQILLKNLNPGVTINALTRKGNFYEFVVFDTHVKDEFGFMPERKIAQIRYDVQSNVKFRYFVQGGLPVRVTISDSRGNDGGS